MPDPITGLIGASVGSTVVGGVAGNKAAKSQAKSADAATNLQREIYYQNRADGAHYREAGKNALAALSRSARIGVDPSQQFTEFQTSPGFQFQQQQGEQAINRNFAARGLRSSGPAMKDLMRFNSGLANSEFGQYQNRLAALAGVGQTQLARDQQGGQAFANAAGANMRAAGDARASGYQNFANSFNSGINNVFSIYGAKQAGYFG